MIKPLGLMANFHTILTKTAMLYLLWGLLNIGLFIYFIVISIKATKLVREKVGLFASLIFIFGLLSFGGRSNNDDKEPNSNQNKNWKFVSEDSLKSNVSYSIHVDLEKTLISKYYLSIEYGEDTLNKINFPISAYSSTTGTISGTNWKPKSIMVYKTNENNKFMYSVYGIVEWKLLWLTVYTQLKAYKGIAMTK